MISTTFVLVRPEFAKPKDCSYRIMKTEEFNTDGFSFFRITGTEPPMEEWVPTDKLTAYKEAYPYG